MGVPERAGDESGSTSNKPGSAGDTPGSARDKPGSAGEKPGSAGDMSGSTTNHTRAGWEKNFLLGNAAGEPGNYSYFLSFNDF